MRELPASVLDLPPAEYRWWMVRYPNEILAQAWREQTRARSVRWHVLDVWGRQTAERRFHHRVGRWVHATFSAQVSES